MNQANRYNLTWKISVADLKKNEWLFKWKMPRSNHILWCAFSYLRKTSKEDLCEMDWFNSTALSNYRFHPLWKKQISPSWLDHKDKIALDASRKELGEKVALS